MCWGPPGPIPGPTTARQPIIDTEHYRRVEEGLQYVAHAQQHLLLHVHVGVRDIDRAIRVCDRLRPVLPLLLAISANSPYVDGRDSGLHSARTQTFTKSFPRCGVPDAFGGWHAYRDYIEFLVRTSSIVEFTQVWWSVRPHFALRHRRDAHLRRAEQRHRVRGARGADRRLRRAGGARCR